MFKNKLILMTICSIALFSNCYGMELIENAFKTFSDSKVIADDIQDIRDQQNKRRETLQNRIEALNIEISQMEDTNPDKADQIKRLGWLEQQIADMDFVARKSAARWDALGQRMLDFLLKQ